MGGPILELSCNVGFDEQRGSFLPHGSALFWLRTETGRWPRGGQWKAVHGSVYSETVPVGQLRGIVDIPRYADDFLNLGVSGGKVSLIPDSGALTLEGAETTWSAHGRFTAVKQWSW
jgi:hypothetical protein